MPRRVLNGLLGVVLLVCLALIWLARRDFARPNAEFLPDMAHSPAYGAFSPNPNFPDGKTLQLPPAGTIVRGHAPLHYAATLQDSSRAGQELRNPFVSDDVQAAQRGAAVFASFCQHCHGPTGQGDGLVVKRGFPPPPSLTAQHALGMKDGQMFHVVTYGQGNMPGHAAQLSRADRWRAIIHVRTLQAHAARSQPAAAMPSTGASQP